MPGVLRFSDLELDLARYELRRNRQVLRLERIPMDLLVFLVERHGQLVTREEIIQRIWGKDVFVDTESAINTAIRKIRQALKDDPANPQFVERVPGKGYRFIGEVAGFDPAAGVASEFQSGKHSSIAVLPFTNLSSDPADECFSDGISEEIINALSKLAGLRVAARTSSFSFKGRAVEIAEIGRKLGVATVLEGSVRKAGNRIRITVQLANVADGFHLWSERYDREMEDIFAVQDEIARSIAERLKVTLKGDHQPLVKAGTDNLEAYQCYLKGRALAYQRGRGLQQGAEYLKRAVALDSTYALAWAELAAACIPLPWYSLMRPEEIFPQAKEAATNAIQLDDSLAEAHVAQAYVYTFCDWKWRDAEREFLRALELNPRYVLGLDLYGVWYLQAVCGRFEEGLVRAKQAVELDPLSGYASANVAWAYAFSDRSAEGLPVAERACELDRESIFAQLVLAYSLYFQRRFKESIAVTEAGLSMSGRQPLFMALLALAYADSGKSEKAQAVHAELLARAGWEYVPPALLAISAAGAGEMDGAMRHAREAYAIRDPQLTTLGRHWPGTKRLREDFRFREILASMG